MSRDAWFGWSSAMVGAVFATWMLIASPWSTLECGPAQPTLPSDAMMEEMRQDAERSWEEGE